jgi:RimJ/RimL family protein N-acetyltransferase
MPPLKTSKLVTGPIIRTDRLVLRPFRKEDLPVLTQLLDTLEDRSLFQEGNRRLSPARLAALMIRESGARPEPGLLRLSLAIVPRRGRRAIGGARLSRDSKGGAEIGMWLTRERRAQGLGCEALQALIQAGFDLFGCSRIHGSCAAENHASRKLMESCGMQMQCTFVAEDDRGRLVKRVSYGIEPAPPKGG